DNDGFLSTCTKRRCSHIAALSRMRVCKTWRQYHRRFATYGFEAEGEEFLEGLWTTALVPCRVPVWMPSSVRTARLSSCRPFKGSTRLGGYRVALSMDHGENRSSSSP
ncbi:unnamed protein product, partial [Meganyctiphanes norvegica]